MEYEGVYWGYPEPEVFHHIVDMQPADIQVNLG